jgi:hypothetical protein
MELFFGSSPAMLGRNKSKIDNLKSPSPVPLWTGSIQNRKSKIQNRLTLVHVFLKDSIDTPLENNPRYSKSKHL